MSPQAGSSSARYTVKAKLGQGGMGVVYQATDLQSGQDIALKRLLLTESAKSNAKYLELFHQEFRTLAQLTHPNVVAVHDFGADEQGPYYSMELLEGEDLQALAPLHWGETCALMRDVCSAIALLHSRRLLHRDLSPRNVKRTGKLRAKVLDFGAMAPMGPCKTIVGTPPLVPPEALLQQPLDARADLFAVGGTMYYALTGQHAYRARSIEQLRAAWARPPLPPSAYVPGIPSELDQLVLSLLSLEPLARPSSAAEVIDRLSAIASLPRTEHAGVSRSYLWTPELVARGDALSQLRRQLAALHGQRGGVIAIEGAAGMGRSRMLDTCVVEAKLAHLAVARANAADAANGSYGALGALVRQLGEMRTGSRAAMASAPELGLLATGGITPELDTARRPELQAAFRAQLKAVAREQPLVLAIDDIERCDEPSLAALAVVAADARIQVLIAVTCLPVETKDHSGPLAILLHRSARVPLTKFTSADTEALLASVFGEVPNLHMLATRIHERAEGSPRGCMELSQYLLDHGLVRYAMGSWLLPTSLAETALPRTLTDARREKLAALSPDARELAEALALAEDAVLEVDAFAELTEAGDQERVHSALDELLFVQILRREQATYVFEARCWPEELQAVMDAADARRASGRIAEALARRGRDRLEVASYRLRAGNAAAAIDLLIEELAQGTRWHRAPAGYGRLLRSAINACSECARARSDRMVLLHELIKVDQDLAAPDLREHTLELLRELRVDSGLALWEEPGGPTEPTARLQDVCARMQQQYETCSPHERGIGQLKAIIALAMLVSETAGLAARTGDNTLLDILPKLVPFYPFSPIMQRIDEATIPACRAVLAGRYLDARELYQKQLAHMLDPATAGVAEEVRTWAIRALHYGTGSIEASLGREQALAHATEIEDVPGWLVPAHSIRQIYYLTMGNLREAERYRRQIELTRLRSPIKPPFAAAAVYQHVYVFSMTDNPNGMRAAIPELEALAASHPGVGSFVLYARAEHARICGNYQEALEWIERARQQVRPGDHPVWPWLVTSRLLTLFAQGRYEEVREIGLRETETAGRLGLTVIRAFMDVPLALAQAKLSDYAGACARIEHIIEERIAGGMLGVALGVLHEARARIALWMNDTEAFERHAQLCAHRFSKSGGDPALAAMYERLLQEARHYGLSTTRDLVEAMASHTTVVRPVESTIHDMLRGASGTLAACDSRQQRLQRAVELLAEGASAPHAELFVVEANALVQATSTADGLSGSRFVPSLSHMLAVDRGADAVALTAALELVGPTLPDGSPTHPWPLLLVHMMSDDRIAVAGAVVLYFRVSAPVRLPTELVHMVAATLINAGDVIPYVFESEDRTMLR